jgi:RimJ/RimL family protein N-acetyltransferase
VSPARSPKFTRLKLGKPWCEAIELNDGRQYLLRPMQAEDAPVLRQSFARLTPEEIRMRFMHPIKELTPAYSQKLTRIDSQREIALVVVENKHPDEALIGAVARAAIDDDGREAEFAIIVGQEISQHGLGQHLLKRLIEWARKKRLDAIYGFVLRDNHKMLGLARRLGFQFDYSQDEDDITLVRLPLKA